MANLKERLEKKKKELADRSAGGAFLTIKEGKTRVRHLPVGDEKEFVIEAVYFYLGEKIKGVVSPKTIGKKCAIMEAYNTLSASKKAEDRELAAKFKPQKKYFSPVVVYKDDKGGETFDEVKMLALTSGLYQDILELFLDEENGDFTDPQSGYDLKYTRQGKGKQDTKYGVMACKPTALPKKFRGKEYDPEELIKKIIPTYEETKSMIEDFLSLPPEEEDEPKKKKEKVIKKKKKTRDL
jgi:hypothetical protein